MNSECIICYEPFSSQDEALECGHWVHKNCIIKWGVNQCPLCRTTLHLNIPYTPPTSDGGWSTIERELGARVDPLTRKRMVLRMLKSISKSNKSRCQPA